MKVSLLTAFLFGSSMITACEGAPPPPGTSNSKKVKSGDASGTVPTSEQTQGDHPAGHETAMPATPMKPTTPTMPMPPADSNALTYANLNARLFSVHCTSCHGVAGGNVAKVNYESYAKVKAGISHIKSHTLDLKNMPPDAPVSEELQKLLADWIAKGLPEK